MYDNVIKFKKNTLKKHYAYLRVNKNIKQKKKYKKNNSNFIFTFKKFI